MYERDLIGDAGHILDDEVVFVVVCYSAWGRGLNSDLVKKGRLRTSSISDFPSCLITRTQIRVHRCEG
jgi:hypothetical protein